MKVLNANSFPEIPTEEPVALGGLIKAIAIIILGGVIVFNVFEPTSDQYAYLLGVIGFLEVVVTFFQRNSAVALGKFNNVVSAETVMQEAVSPEPRTDLPPLEENSYVPEDEM